MSMTCKWVYKGHEFNSEIELDDFLIENKRFESTLGDMVFSLTSAQANVANILEEAHSESEDLRQKYKEWLESDKVTYSEDGEEAVEAPPYIGVNKYVSQFKDENGKRLVPEFIKEEYWKRRFEDWKTGKFNDTEIEVFELSKDNLPNITDKKLANQLKDKMEFKWKMQAKIGTAIHNIPQICFEKVNNKYVIDLPEADLIQYIKDHTEQKNLKYLTDKVIKQGIEYAKSLRADLQNELGEDLLFYPEFGIAQDANTGVKLFGIIDLLVRDKNGIAHIVDYKTAIHSYNEFSLAKRMAYHYQMATYQRMLEKKGLNVYGGNLMVAPIKIEGFKKDEDIYTYSGISYASTYTKLSTTNQKVWDSIDEFMPSSFNPIVSAEEAGKNISEVMSHWCPNYQANKTYDEKATINKLKKMGLLTPNENGVYTFRKYQKGETPITASSEAEFVTKVTKYLQSLPAARLRFTQEIKNTMKQAIKNGIDNVDFYAPTYIDKDAEVTWIKSILSPYCNSNWQIVDNQVTESYGVLMLKSNDGQLDLIRVSTSALDRQVVTDESKKTNVDRKYLTGQYVDDVVEKSKSNSLMVKGVQGNVELMETLLLLNNLTGIDGVTIGNISVVNPLEGNGMRMSNEELAYCFRVMNSYYSVGKNKFADGTIKFATKYELAWRTFNHILQQGEEHEWHDQYRNLREFKSSKSILDQAIDGSVDDKIKALQQLLVQLEGRNKPNKNISEKEVGRIHTKQSQLSNEYILLYNTSITAIADLKGINFRQQLEDHDKWLQSIFIWKEGVSGTYLDNPGNLDSETLNLITKLVTEAYQNTRDDMQRNRATVMKYVENIKKAHNFGFLEENTVGNQVNLYKDLYKQTADGNLLFKNLNEVHIQEDREFLRYALDIINHNRFPQKTQEQLDAMRDSGAIEYYQVPLAIGDLDSIASTNGMLSMFKAKLSYLLPSKAWKLARQKAEGIFNSEEDLDRQKSELMFSMTNMFDKGENPETRISKIKELGVEKLEKNLETLLLKHMFAYSVQQNMDEVFPLIKASMINLTIQGAMRNKVYGNDISYMSDYIRNKVQNQQIVNEKSAKWLKTANKIKQAASTMTLAFSPVQALYQPLQGLWQDISLMIRKPDGTNAFTFSHFQKALRMVYSDLSQYSDEPTLFQLVNETYGMNDMDMNTYTDRISTAKKGIWNWDNFMYKFASRPDYYNRSTIFACQMMGDGCLEAHTVKNGKLVYDWTKDKRFDKFAANPNLITKDIEYNKQKALYYTIAQQFVTEHAKNSDGTLFELNMSKPMALPRAYTNKQAESMKSLADDIYGYYSHEKKSLVQATALGSMWLQFKTYWSGKKNQYLGAGGVKLRGKWEQKEENGQKYYYQTDENGNILFDEAPLTEEQLKEKGMSPIAPVMVWKGQWQEGIILTLYKLSKAMYDSKSIAKGFQTIWNTEDSNLKTAYRSNMKQFLYDLIMFALVGSILGVLLGDWLDELKKDNKKNRDFVEGLKVAAANIAVMSVKNSFLDLNFIDSVGTPIGQWTPFAFDWGSRTFSNWWNVAMGDEDFWDGVVKSFGGLKQIKPVLDTIKPDMFRTKSEGGTFGE